MQLPRLVSKYELLEFLGGGMSHVYRARDTVLGREVAVKILTEAGCQDDEMKARFLLEARLSSNISHDNIIRIHDYGEVEGVPFIVMEFLTGEDLRHAIDGNRTGDVLSRIRIALQTARALGFVHSKQIIHRDIKPDNLHIDPSGRVRLMDFGIAKSADHSITRTNTSMGTPYYMSPEQVMGKGITPRVDIYSFGLVVYELLMGFRPIHGDTIERLFFVIIHEGIDLEPLRQANVPAALVDLISRCVARKPDERPANFQEVVEDLERIFRSLESGQVPAVIPRPPAPPTPGSLADSPTVGVRPRPDLAAAKPPAGPVATPSAGKRLPLVYIGLAVALIAVISVIAMIVSRGSKDGTAADGKAKGSNAVESAQSLAPALTTDTGSMTLVPAGRALFGEKREPATVAAFYIDTTEAPNSIYEKFCYATGRALPVNFARDKPDYPVVSVSVYDAQAFCQWAGKRLPTGREWEKAARGADGNVYPWGDQVEASRANVSDNQQWKGAGLQPVNSMPEGGSPYHVLNMAGNVWELAMEPLTPSAAAVQNYASLLTPPPTATEPWYMARGGSFNGPLAEAVSYEWISVPARFTAPNIGFRCVKDPR